MLPIQHPPLIQSAEQSSTPHSKTFALTEKQGPEETLTHLLALQTARRKTSAQALHVTFSALPSGPEAEEMEDGNQNCKDQKFGMQLSFDAKQKELASHLEEYIDTSAAILQGKIQHLKAFIPIFTIATLNEPFIRFIEDDLIPALMQHTSTLSSNDYRDWLLTIVQMVRFGNSSLLKNMMHGILKAIESPVHYPIESDDLSSSPLEIYRISQAIATSHRQWLLNALLMREVSLETHSAVEKYIFGALEESEKAKQSKLVRPKITHQHENDSPYPGTKEQWKKAVRGLVFKVVLPELQQISDPLLRAKNIQIRELINDLYQKTAELEVSAFNELLLDALIARNPQIKHKTQLELKRWLALYSNTPTRWVSHPLVNSTRRTCLHTLSLIAAQAINCCKQKTK